MKRLMTACLALCLSLPTFASAQTLTAQIRQATEATAKYRNFNVAKHEGWKPFGGDEPLMGQHWSPPEGRDYVSGQPLDFTRPSNLMYSDVNGVRQLVALSYNVRIAPGEPVPAGFAGGSDVWHVHDMAAFVDAATADRPVLGWLARGWLEGEVIEKDGKSRLAMVHLWLIPNPAGRFASHNPALAYLDLGLPADWAADMDAARGVALASPEGCDEALEGDFWVANVDRATQRTLKSICGQLAGFVRDKLGSDKATLNAHGRGACRKLEEELDARLSVAQKMRIAAISEHGEHMDH